jgi:hypothetical protein
LQAGDARATETIRVLADPLLPLTVAQHKERESFQLELGDKLGEVVTMSQQLATMRRTSLPAVMPPRQGRRPAGRRVQLSSA